MAVRLKRAFEPAAASDGPRYLVDRLWPRGVSKDRLRLTAWLKDLAPTDDLRRWYGHDPGRFDEFRRRYREQLGAQTKLLHELRHQALRGTITLVFATRAADLSNAAVLAELLTASAD